MSWVTSEAPLPFQQGLIWRTRSQVPWALMSALHSTPPSQPRRLCRNLDPLTTPYSHKSFTPGTEGEELCSSGETENKQKARKSTQSLVLTRPACIKHITSARLRSLGATGALYTRFFQTQTLIYTSVIDRCTHKGLQDSA